MKPHIVWAMLLAGAAMSGRAQSPAPAPSAAPAPSPATVNDKGAMERALQQADGPRRRILEAARSKNAVKPDAPASAPAEALPAVRPTHAATPPPPRPAPVREEPPATPMANIVRLPNAPQPLAVPEGGKVDEVPGVAAPEKLAEPVPMVDLAPAARPAVALPMTPPATLALPRLLSKVDPELPPRLLRRGLSRTEVQVNLTINTDGSVRDVNLRSTGNAELDASVLEAVRQWRYDTQPAARPHQVILVVAPS